MKRLSMKLLFLLSMIVGGPLFATSDRDECILQDFLFYSIYSQSVGDTAARYTYTPDVGGKVVFSGPEEELSSFLARCTHALQKGIAFEPFCDAKREFICLLEEAGALLEKGIAEEIEWELLPLGVSGVKELLEEMKREMMPEVRVMRAPISLDSNDNPNTQLYYNLRLNQDDQKNIEKLIKKLADLNVFELLMKKKEMESLGNKIKPVHPLRFIGYINSRSDLKRRLSKIKGNHFKWKSFVGGFGERMASEASKNNLLPFVPGFSQATGVSCSKVESLVRNHDWEGLVRSIM